MTNANTLQSSNFKTLFFATRPKTLVASIVPVITATALAYHHQKHVNDGIFIATLLCSLLIQIATNFFNDAIDFEKGADSDTRLGPSRAAHQGWWTGMALKKAAGICLAAAFVMGIALVAIGGWPIAVIGLVSIFLAYGYTGGPFPLAYRGLGELFVLIFFGWIAVGGTYYLQTETFNTDAFVLGTQVGLYATVLIFINNLRDVEQDAKVGKKTLCVRLSWKKARWFGVALLLSTVLLSFYWWQKGDWLLAGPAFCLMPLITRLARSIVIEPPSRGHNLLLAKAALVQILFGVAMTFALIWKA